MPRWLSSALRVFGRTKKDTGPNQNKHTSKNEYATDPKVPGGWIYEDNISKAETKDNGTENSIPDQDYVGGSRPAHANLQETTYNETSAPPNSTPSGPLQGQGGDKTMELAQQSYANNDASKPEPTTSIEVLETEIDEHAEKQGTTLKPDRLAKQVDLQDSTEQLTQTKSDSDSAKQAITQDKHKVQNATADLQCAEEYNSDASNLYPTDAVPEGSPPVMSDRGQLSEQAANPQLEDSANLFCTPEPEGKNASDEAHIDEADVTNGDSEESTEHATNGQTVAASEASKLVPKTDGPEIQLTTPKPAFLQTDKPSTYTKVPEGQTTHTEHAQNTPEHGKQLTTTNIINDANNSWDFGALDNDTTLEKHDAAKSDEVTQAPAGKDHTPPINMPNDSSAIQSKGSILSQSKPTKPRPFVEESDEESGGAADTQKPISAAKASHADAELDANESEDSTAADTQEKAQASSKKTQAAARSPASTGSSTPASQPPSALPAPTNSTISAPQSTPVSTSQTSSALQNVTRQISLPQGNDIIEDGQAATLLVVDFPTLSFGFGAKGGTASSTEPFKSAGNGGKKRLPDEDTLYDSKGAVELLKFCYTQKDTTYGASSLRKFKKNFSSKGDCIAHAPSGQPAWIEVNPGQLNEERFFLSYAGKIALWGKQGGKKHNFLNTTYTNQNKVREGGLTPLMLIGNVDVPESRIGKKLTKLPLKLFKPFTIQPSKSDALRKNNNASRSVDTSPAPSATPKRKRKGRHEDPESDQETTPIEEPKKRKKVKVEPSDDDDDSSYSRTANERSAYENDASGEFSGDWY